MTGSEWAKQAAVRGVGSSVFGAKSLEWDWAGAGVGGLTREPDQANGWRDTRGGNTLPGEALGRSFRHVPQGPLPRLRQQLAAAARSRTCRYTSALGCRSCAAKASSAAAA
jgi:hypothetical protein